MTTEAARTGAALVAYDGAAFHGWQRHPGRPTVQGALEGLLGAALGTPVQVQGSGRTDRGAHAFGQVASFALPSDADVAALSRALTSGARDALTVRAVAEAPPGFHARADATGKVYRYVLWRREFGGEDAPADAWSVGGVRDLGAMRAALEHLVGTHDFATFATPAGHERTSTTRTVSRAELSGDGARIELEFEADGFLYKMVRNLVRGLVKVGEGRKSADWMGEALAARDRRAASGSAPASGLTLVRVHYPFELFGGAE